MMIYHKRYFALLVLIMFILQGCDRNNSDQVSVDTECEEAECQYTDLVEYEYDELGRLLMVRYGSGYTEEYSYDDAGNLITVEKQKATP